MNDVSAAWLPVPGWERSQVSDTGQVRGPRGKLLRQFQRPDGYMQVILHQGKSRLTRKVHRLVALAFLGPCPAGLEVRHIDGNPANNAVGNLVYGTHTENVLDLVRHGRHPQASQTHCVNGHEFTPANTLVAYGRRNCRACAVERSRKHYRNKVAR